MSPNLPPQLPGGNPNFVRTPGANLEPLIEPNIVPPGASQARVIAELGEKMEQLMKVKRDQNTSTDLHAVKTSGLSAAHQAIHAAHRQKRQSEIAAGTHGTAQAADAIEGEIAALVLAADTSTLLRVMTLRTDRAAERFQTRTDTFDTARAAALTTEHDARVKGANTVITGQPSGYGRAQHDANRAALAADNAYSELRKWTGAGSMVGDILVTVQAEQERKLDLFRKEEKRARAVLAAWEFGTDQPMPPRTAFELEASLDNISDLLSPLIGGMPNPDALNITDSARAELVEIAVKLNYRHQSRKIVSDPNYTDAQYNGDDRSIIMHAMTASGAHIDTIIYEDGTQTSPGGTHRVDSRRQEARVDAPQLEHYEAHVPPQAVSTLTLETDALKSFTDWEANPVAGTAEQAHLRLSEVENRLNTTAGNYSATMAKLTAEDADIRNKLQTASKMSLQQETDLRNRLATIRAEHMAAMADLRNTRERVGTLSWRRRLIESGTQVQAQTRWSRLGGTVLGGSMKRNPEVVSLHSKGLVELTPGFFIGQDATFRIYPDGSCIRYEPDGSETTFDAKGPLYVVPSAILPPLRPRPVPPTP